MAYGKSLAFNCVEDTFDKIKTSICDENTEDGGDDNGFIGVVGCNNFHIWICVCVVIFLEKEEMRASIGYTIQFFKEGG